jgi:hypothetical protein
MSSQTRFFPDLEVRPRDELEAVATQRRRSYALVTYDGRRRPRSATLLVDGRIEGVRWFAPEPSPALHAAHRRHHDGLPYSVCHDQREAGQPAVLRTVWEIVPSGEIWAREMRWYPEGIDGAEVETWRYDGAAGGMRYHFLHQRGRLVRGEEYGADGQVLRTVADALH